MFEFIDLLDEERVIGLVELGFAVEFHSGLEVS